MRSDERVRTPRLAKQLGIDLSSQSNSTAPPPEVKPPEPIPDAVHVQRVWLPAEGVTRVQFVGTYHTLRMGFLLFQIGVWVTVLVFHDSILAYIGEQIGRNAMTVGGGIARGLWR